jgi:SWI/SNF related-matrix-associated actin-dependent regulator of chromatin subfamily C
MDQAVRVPSGSKIGNVGAELPDPSLIPFADAPNPVMAQLAFLTTMLSPRVAAASAKAALNELTSSGPSWDVSAERVKAAAGVGLAAAALEAKLLAQDEEHEINRLMSGVIDLQTRKLDLKMQRLSCIDEVLSHEQNFFGISRRGAHASRLEVLTQKQHDSERLPKLLTRLAELKAQVGQEL